EPACNGCWIRRTATRAPPRSKSRDRRCQDLDVRKRVRRKGAWVAYGPLGEETLSHAVSLRKARRDAWKDRRATERRFLTAPFPLYGLPPDWPGKRFLG